MHSDTGSASRRKTGRVDFANLDLSRIHLPQAPLENLSVDDGPFDRALRRAKAVQEIDRAAHALLGTPDDASRDEINMKLDTLERLNTRRHVEVLDKLEQLRGILLGKP